MNHKENTQRENISLEFHPVAAIFPMMDEVSLSELTEDISKNGLLEPIWLDKDGLIIDGRNRYLACKKSGIDPTYRTYEGAGSLVSFVVSLNLKRRHLNPLQKSIIAVDIEKLFAVEAKERQRAAGVFGVEGGRGNKKEKTLTAILPEGLDLNTEETQRITDILPESMDGLASSQRALDGADIEPIIKASKERQKEERKESRIEAAKVVGVGQHYVSDAKKLAATAPDVIEAAMSGKIKTMPDALKVAKLPEEQRKTVIEKVQSGEKVSQAIHETKQADRVANSEWTESELERKDMVERGLTVVAHQNNDAHLIAWAEDNGKYVRIDRFSDWGNPFLLPQDGDRDIVIDHYRQYLEWRPSLQKRLGELKGKVLGCWCYPEDCHGDVLIEAINVHSN
jgi:ParB-like chromosome segregation protein Spo0J